MKRLAVLYDPRGSLWSSAQTIATNLKSVYQGLDEGLCHFLEYSEKSLTGQKLVNELLREQPEAIIFTCDFPLPTRLLAEVVRHWDAKRLPEIYIHLYGDFTVHLEDWLKAEKILKKFRIKFLCASPKQVRLLSQLFREPRRNLCHFPFPVNESVFFFSPDLRASWRKKQGLRASDRVILYSGRISLQKNTARLLSELALLLEGLCEPVRVFFAGSFDDWGSQILGIRYPPGFYYSFWTSVLSSLPRHLRGKVELLGELSTEELNAVSCGADLFVSLSLHHDEDFGMAPAEALCAGLPAVLTDWGGYSDLGRGRAACAYIPVRLLSGYPSLDSNEIQRALRNKFLHRESETSRRALSRFYASQFGVKNLSQALRRILNGQPAPRFSGFASSARSIQKKVLNQDCATDLKKYAEFYEAYR